MNDQPLTHPVPLSDEDRQALLEAVDHLSRTGLHAPLPDPENFPPVARETRPVADSSTDR